MSVLHHAIFAENTTGRSLMLTLDTIDRYLQIALPEEDWPFQSIVPQQDWSRDWNFNFLAYAVRANIYRFVEDKLRQRPDIIKERKGCPLLSFALGHPALPYPAFPYPRAELGMVQLLLDHGAKAQEQWVNDEGEKINAFGTILQPSKTFPDCNSEKEIISLLLRNGADPNLRTHDSNDYYCYPVNRVIAWGFYAEIKMEILRALKKAGANFAAEDFKRRTMLHIHCEDLLQGIIGQEVTITELEWVIKAGALITADMFNSDGFKETLLYNNALRRPEYYTRDGRDAARKDNPE